MSALEAQVIQALYGMPDDDLKVILGVIQCIKKPFVEKSQQESAPTTKRIGLCKGEKFFADGYDLDDCNDEIAEMFGVNE